MPFDGDLVGKRFGRYRIAQKIGIGGMAEVYRAETSSDKGIAIKKIMASFTNSEKFIKMFLDEAKIMITLRHPNIVELYDFGKIEDVYYLAMEYVNGKPLGSLIRRQIKKRMMFPPGLAVYVAMEICSGLDYAHNKKDSFNQVVNIVHRDISPPNILISWDGEVKIADFGIAKAANKVILTKPGILKGKFSYMSLCTMFTT
jgi:serine/threonine protein kinase